MTVGIDIGGTTTDIVGVHEGRLIEPLSVTASDPIASAAGALGKFMADRHIGLSGMSRVAVTGVGAGKIGPELMGIPTANVSEFDAIGIGGSYLTGISRGIVVSMGTGTAVVHVEGNTITHWGGTGVGGGTLIGLAKQMIGASDFDYIVKKASTGRLERVDLTVGDIADPVLLDMSTETTASNFGKMSDDATDEDVAMAIVNLVCQTVGIVAAGAARATGVKQIVVTGKIATVPRAAEVFEHLSSLYDLEYTIPENASYSTAIGAAVAVSRLW